MQLPSSAPRESFAVELAGAGQQQTIGRITLRERAGEVARLGVYLSPEWTGKGYGRAALNLFISQCFSKEGLRRLVLDVAASNQRALKCYLGLGFVVVEHQWREIGDDPALKVLDQAEYRSLKPYFRGQHALFFELVLRVEEWYDDVYPCQSHAFSFAAS